MSNHICPSLDELPASKRKPLILTDPHDIQQCIIDKYKTFVFDMDGVLWRLNEPIPGVDKALQKLVASGKRIFFVTNNSLVGGSTFQEKLERLNLGVFPAESVLGSSWAAAQCLKATGYKGKVYMIGPPNLLDELKKIDGLTIIDSSIHSFLSSNPSDFVKEDVDTTIGAVVMGFDTDLNYYKIAYATSILNHNPSAHLIFTNADHQFPTSKWILPGNGAFISTLQVATGRKGIIAGKPGPVMIQEILSRNPDLSCNDICMIGDNLTTDIPFGNLNSLATVLVETGVHTRNDIPKYTDGHNSRFPMYIIPTLALMQ